MATTSRPRTAQLDWGARAIVSGFMATIAMGIVLIISYVIASNIASTTDGTILRWFYGLTHNKITTTTQNSLFLACALYLAFGLIWALLYARIFEPLLRGPGWLEGLVFAMIPFVLSLLVFLPSVGGGVAGVSFNAGPLPFVGNFILHVVYGIVLGLAYDSTGAIRVVDGDEEAADEGAVRSEQRSTNRASAIGILSGIVLGAIIGIILGVYVYPPSTGPASDNLITGAGELSLACAVLGAGLGALAGSLFGLSSSNQEEP